MAENNKMSRRDFFKGMAQKIRLANWQEDNISGLHPVLREADEYLKNENYEEARKNYEEFLQEEPGHIEALKMAGFCCLHQENFEEALNYWDKVEQIRPDDFCTLYKGIAFARQGSLQDAIYVWKSYFNIKKPLIQREINVTLALVENGEELDPLEVAENIEKAISLQKKS